MPLVQQPSSLITFRKYVVYHLFVHETRKCRRVSSIQADRAIATFVLFIYPAYHEKTPVTRGPGHRTIFLILGRSSRITTILIHAPEYSCLPIRTYLSSRHFP